MYSDALPASGSRNIAANALRNAGILDRDERMRDASDKPGGRKGSHKVSHKSRTSHRPRAIDALTGKDQAATSSRTAMLASRLAAGDSLAIRGAAKGPLGRLRRNAVSTGATAESSSGVVEKWKDFVKRRWNAEAKFLNLERVAEDEYVQRNRIWVPGSAEKELSVMFKLASVHFPEVQTISLAYNNIVSGRVLSRLPHYLPNLVNLSLQGNRLSSWRDLDYISGRKGKLSQLRELILLDNPLRNAEYEKDRGDRYKSEVARRLPSLEMLDMEPIPKIAFDVPQASTSHPTTFGPAPTSFPVDMGDSFITGVDGALLSGFLMRFLPLFDNQRTALMDAYHPNATFSISCNTSVPVRARIEGHRYSKEMPHQRKQEWSRWGVGKAGVSRNLNRLAGGSVDKLARSLHVGNEEIVKAMAELPTTKHDVAGTPEKFCIDAWPVQQGDSPQLFVTIHGQFEEQPTRCVMSFDRSFILAPAPEGSRAKQNGWDVVILSDMLVVRQYSSHEAWRPGPMRVQAGDPIPPAEGTSTSPQSTSSLQQTLATMPEPQRSLVMQICHRTGLNVDYAVQCLEGNAWDVQRAIANFEQVKSTLSREAFL